MSPSEIKKFEYIDALRGMAILGVILIHSSQSLEPTHPMLRWLAGEGSSGVQLFYVASAITLCMSWAARSAHERFPIRSFYIRRYFRIAPMFYVAILGYLLIDGLQPRYWAPNGIEWWFVPLAATFINGYHPETITSVVPGGWSIAVEMNFYLILPLLLSKIRSVKSCLVVFAISLFLYFLNRFIVPHVFSYPEDQQYLIRYFPYLNFFGQLPVFIIGIACYLVLREKYPRRNVAVLAAPLLVVFLLVFCFPVRGLQHHHVAGALFAVFALLLANWPARLFVNPATIALGKLSYSMYLTHFAILTCFSRLGFTDVFPRSDSGSLLHFSCVVLVTAAVSFPFYHYVEKTGIALGKRLIEKLEQQPVKSARVGIDR